MSAAGGALVLFSGGQDSTTCLAWALSRYERVETIGFDYGQRHRIELDCRDRIRDHLRNLSAVWDARLAEDHLLDLSILGRISETSLTRPAAITLEAGGLPNTFVPGRNLLFLTFAAAIAYRRDLSVLVGGMCETDFSGYPDCREQTIRAMQTALALGLDREISVVTPLMWLDKAQTWSLACELGGSQFAELIRTETHTCYLGVHDELHPWGYGCGSCPGCELRANGYARWQRAA